MDAGLHDQEDSEGDDLASLRLLESYVLRAADAFSILYVNLELLCLLPGELVQSTYTNWFHCHQCNSSRVKSVLAFDHVWQINLHISAYKFVLSLADGNLYTYA